MSKKNLTAAANLGAPSYKVLVESGYKIVVKDNVWIAENNKWILRADGPIQLLGLASLVEKKDENWRVTDKEIDEFLEIIR
ncbi:hypothetical protein [Aquimarina algiphila]|uniref:hypothetical protein n=1 Tax=Aquimarina algiphila TaxID=2047982 RepID=UPI0024929A34|nr:hypothetical protein [Aquimarina algiphila]